jgi:hypothetical protein
MEILLFIYDVKEFKHMLDIMKCMLKQILTSRKNYKSYSFSSFSSFFLSFFFILFLWVCLFYIYTLSCKIVQYFAFFSFNKELLFNNFMDYFKIYAQ